MPGELTQNFRGREPIRSENPNFSKKYRKRLNYILTMVFYLGFYKLNPTSATRPARTGQALHGAQRPTSNIFCKSSTRRTQILQKTRALPSRPSQRNSATEHSRPVPCAREWAYLRLLAVSKGSTTAEIDGIPSNKIPFGALGPKTILNGIPKRFCVSK